MCDRQYGLPSAAAPGVLHDQLPGLLVQAPEGFVQDEEVIVSQQPAENRDPAPEGAISPVTRPAANVPDTFRSTAFPLKDFHSPRITISIIFAPSFCQSSFLFFEIFFKYSFPLCLEDISL